MITRTNADTCCNPTHHDLAINYPHRHGAAFRFIASYTLSAFINLITATVSILLKISATLLTARSALPERPAGSVASTAEQNDPRGVRSRVYTTD